MERLHSSLMARRLDASSLSLLCMTVIYCATEAKTNPTRHSERNEESRKKQYLCILVIKSVWHQLHADVWVDWVKFFESRIQLSAIADGRWTATGLSPFFISHRLFLRVLHPQTPHKVSDLDQKDACASYHAHALVKLVK